MKILAFIGYFLTATLTSAQTILKQQSNDNSTEVLINLQTGTQPIGIKLEKIKYRRFISDKFAYRVTMIAALTKETTTINSLQQSLMERKVINKSITIAPGFEKHSRGTARLSPYWGIEMPLGLLGYEYNLTNSTDGQNFTSGGNFNRKTKKSYIIGANFIAGLDYYLAKKIFIGLEVGYGYSYINYGNSVVSSTAIADKTIPMGSASSLNVNYHNGLRFGILF